MASNTDQIAKLRKRRQQLVVSRAGFQRQKQTAKAHASSMEITAIDKKIKQLQKNVATRPRPMLQASAPKKSLLLPTKLPRQAAGTGSGVHKSRPGGRQAAGTGSGVHKSRPAHLKPAPGKTRANRADRYDGVPITAQNAAQMVSHYKVLVAKTPILTPLRKHYETRLRLAKNMMIVGASQHRSAASAANRAKAAAQRRLATQARQRKNYAAAQQYEQNAQKFERLDHAAAIQEELPQATDVESWQPYVSSRGGSAPAYETDPSAASEDDASLEVDEYEDETPWYKRYGWLIGGAALVGGAFALSRTKKGRAMLASRGGGSPRPRSFTFPSSPARSASA